MKRNKRAEFLSLAAAVLGLVLPLVSQETKAGAATKLDAAAIFSDARGLYRKGQFDQAAARYNDALKADPRSGEAYAGIVRCYLKQDKVGKAEGAVQKGKLANPSHLDFKVAQAELLYREGNILEAGLAFAEVIASGQPNARAYLGEARVQAASAMHAREHSLIQHAHEIDPTDPDVRKEWMRTLSVDERIKSMEDYLAQPTNDEADTRRAMTERLEFLKAYVSGPRTRCRPTSDLTAADVDLVPIQDSRGSQGVGLQVDLNVQTSRLLLDTGATGILISRKLADQAHLQRVSDVRVSGIGDKPDSQGQIESAETVRIGKLEFHDCPVRVVDRFSAGQDGIIGADVFSQFLIEMDFPGSKLRLSELPRRPGETPSKASLKTGDEEPATESEAKPAAEPGNPARGAQPWDQKYYNRYIALEMEHYVQAFLIDHMLLIPTKINQGPEKLFLLDSGSFDNTITPDAARAVTKVHKAPKVEVRGLNGNVKDVYVAHEVVLDFGHLRQTVPNMVAFDLSRVSRRAGTEVSGTLGMVMLELLKVRLDYRDALADFQYVSSPKRH